MSLGLSKVKASAIALLLSAAGMSFTLSVSASSIDEPRLYEDSDYNEYWEQQFLFGDGTMVTSQFLIANFPFSKQHGLMVATLKRPEENTVIVKNGRQRDGWNFDASEPKLSIYQHQLAGAHPGYLVRLDNTAAEVDILYTATNGAIPLIDKDNNLGLPEVSLYAPTAKAYGRWRAGPEIGGAGTDGDWQELGAGGGYGIHVVQRENMNASLRRWKRFTSMDSKGAFEPVLHEFETPKGDEKKILILISKFGDPIRFEDVTLTENGSDKSWKVSAQGNGATLSGTLKANGNIDEFILEDHLNHLEKLAAGSLSDIKRYRYSGEYSMTLTVNGKDHALSGRALAEDIHLGEVKKKKRRARR